MKREQKWKKYWFKSNYVLNYRANYKIRPVHNRIKIIGAILGTKLCQTVVVRGHFTGAFFVLKSFEQLFSA